MLNGWGKCNLNAWVDGHIIIIDAPEKVGGEDNGPITKPYVLTVLAGSTEWTLQQY